MRLIHRPSDCAELLFGEIVGDATIHEIVGMREAEALSARPTSLPDPDSLLDLRD